MKRLIAAVVILAFILGATLCNTLLLGSFTGELTHLLEQAGQLGRAGSWTQAQILTRQAREVWQGRDSYLHVTLRHADLDQISAGFREVEALLACREEGEYAAANARLITQLELLNEAEQLNLKNVF